MWGGCQPSLPNAHKSEEKRLVSSAVEVFHLPTRKWEQKPTTGNPPLGVSYYAATAIGILNSIIVYVIIFKTTQK